MDPVVVRRVPNGGIQPEAAFDANGVLHLIYFAGTPSGGDLFYVRSTDFGATFTAPVRVNSQPGSAIAVGTIRGGQIAVGRGGRVHVAWNGSDTARPRAAVNPDLKRPGAPFLYARSTADGARFEPQRNLNPDVYSLDGGGAVAADDAGHVYAVWHGNREGEARGEDHRKVWLSRSDDDGATFATAAPVWQAPTGVCGCCQARALATPGGGLFLLYRAAMQSRHRDIYVLASHDSGRSFAGSPIQPWEINACPMTSMSLAAAGPRIAAAWETAGQVYMGTVDSEAARVRAIVAAPGQASGRKHPRLAATPKGEILLVWTEKTAWERGGSIAWQRFDAAGRPQGASGSAPSLPVWSFATVVSKPDGGFLVITDAPGSRLQAPGLQRVKRVAAVPFTRCLASKMPRSQEP